MGFCFSDQSQRGSKSAHTDKIRNLGLAKVTWVVLRGCVEDQAEPCGCGISVYLRHLCPSEVMVRDS